MKEQFVAPTIEFVDIVEADLIKTSDGFGENPSDGQAQGKYPWED